MKFRRLNRGSRFAWMAVCKVFIAVVEFVQLRKTGVGALTLASALVVSPVQARQLPSGGQIAAGQGSISSTDSTMTVTQKTARMAVNWQSFSIGQGNTVNFVQPSASAVALNRVLGSDVSVIQGALNANGQLFLVNPNGVLFTSTAQVNVGGIVASTLDISTEDFMAGNYSFEGSSCNAITNQGNITAADGGTVALIAAEIINTGEINAPQGNVLMGAGSKVTLDLGGPVKIEVEQGALDTLIEQGGAVYAHGGLVYLTAKAAGELATCVINHTGITQARTLATGETGEIYLLADMDQGETLVSGTLDASAPDGGDGGFIETSAATVTVDNDVQITTAAPYGDVGEWLIDPVDITIAASGGNITGETIATALQSTNVTLDTSGSGNCTGVTCGPLSGGSGDIHVNDNILTSADLGAERTLTLKAERDIVFNTGVGIDATQGGNVNKLNVSLISDTDTTNGGAIIFKENSSVKSNGGAILMAGGDGSGYATGGANSYTFGADAHQNGISFQYATVDSRVYSSGSPQSGGGGTITLKGKGYAGNVTKYAGGLYAGWSSIYTGGGDLVIDAQAQQDAGATTGSFRYGVFSGGSTINTNGGDMQISMASPTSWTGFYSLGDSITAGTGDITFSTDQIFLTSGTTISGTGSLTIQPITSGTTIGVGGGAGTLNIAATEWGYFQDGFSSITIGNNTAGAITIGGATTFNDSVTLLTGSTIAINAAVTAGGDLTLQSIGSVTATGDFYLNGGDLIVDAEAESTISGKISGSGGLTTKGSGALTVNNSNRDNDFTGQTTIASGARLIVADNFGESLKTSSQIQNAGTLEFSNSNNVGLIQSVSGAGDIELNTSSVTIENNSGEVSGTISGSGSLTLNGGSLTLSGTNTFTGLVTVNSATLIAKNSNALGDTSSGTSIGNGSTLIIEPETESGITIAEALSVAGTGVGDGGAIINRGTNTLSGAISLAGYDVSVVSESGTLTFANTVNGAQGLTLTGSGEVWFQAEVGADTPLQFLDADAGDTTHIAADITTTGQQIYRNKVSVTNAVTLSAIGGEGVIVNSITNGLPTDAYSISTGESPSGEGVEKAFDGNSGTKYLNHNGEGSDVIISGSESYIVTGLKLTTANDSPQRDPTSYTLYGSANGTDWYLISSGSLDAPTTRYTDYAEVTFENNTACRYYKLVFDTVRKGPGWEGDVQVADICLSGRMSPTGNLQPNITFEGAVAATDNLSVDAAGGININDTMDVDGNLSLNATNSDIASGTAITVAGTASLGAGWGNITLDNENNDFTGAVTIGSGMDVSLRDKNTFALGASTVSGNLTLQTGGELTQTGSLAVTGTTQITAGLTNNITLDDENNNFGGAVSVVSGKDVSIIDQNAMILGAVTSTGKVNIAALTGNLTLTNTITTSDSTDSAVTLNAGKNESAGTAGGGNIIVSGGSVLVGEGGTAKLYSGSVSGSTGLTGLIGSGSTNFRYNSDESASNYSSALSSGIHGIYREQPTVTITAGDDSRTYTGTAYSAGNGYTGSGFVNGDALTGITGSPIYAGTAQGVTDVGTYAIGISGLSSGLGYALSYADGSLTIDPAVLTVTADDQTRSYGASNPTLTQTISGFLNGENASTAGITGTAYGSSAATPESAVGTYLITGSTGTLAANNYTFVAADGILTVTAVNDTPTEPVVDGTSEPQQVAVQTAQAIPPSSIPAPGISDGLAFVDASSDGGSDTTPPMTGQPQEGSTQSIGGITQVFVEDGGILFFGSEDSK